MKSLYLDKAPLRRKRRSFVMPAIAMIFAVIFSTLGLGVVASPLKPVTASADGGPIEWVICNWAGGEGSPAYVAYQVAFTDDIAFMFNSKSAIASGTDDVSTGANMLLGLTSDFKAVNATILGYSLDQTNKDKTAFNGGTKVNPYDRFGFAGMYWTSYGGEWNYLKVNICSTKSAGVDMRVGALYEERLAPISTWGSTSQSNDVRSLVAANKAAVYGNDWINVVANGLFNVTKGAVALTNALIGFAFTDILGASGLGDLVSGSDGIFSKLYTGIYLPLLLLVMLGMACWAFWQGIVKRAYRATLGGIAQSIGLFFLAAIVALNPLFFISLPNNIAIIGQSLVVNAMSTGIYAGDGLCSVGGTFVTDASGNSVPASTNGDGQIDVNPGAPASATNVEESSNLLEQAANSIQSVIGCQIWYTYVLKPWTLGQYGTDFENLWAKGHADTAIYADSTELKNDNEAWVGDAAVPLGGGYIMNNWAIFQISTQTNAHSALGEEAQALPSEYTDGVANDWWRIVDAVSNYNEINQSNSIPTETACDPNSNIANAACDADETTWTDTTPVESTVPDITKVPTDYWQSWIGAKPSDRLGVAAMSIIPAIVGNLAPLAFAGLSAIYSISIAVAMAFAPIFLLFGSFPGNGWRIFKEWGQLVLNLMMKRIVAGILLVLSLVIISMILKVTSDINYFLGVAVISIVSVALFKLRTTIFEKVGGLFSFNFAGGALRDVVAPLAQKATGTIGKGIQSGGRLAGAAATGAVVGNYAKTNIGTDGKSNGKSGAANGAARGFKNELRRMAYQDPTMNRVANLMDQMQTDKTSDQEISKTEVCAYCGTRLYNIGDTEFNGGQLPDGNWVCAACMNGENPESGNPYEQGASWITANYLTNEREEKYREVSEKDAANALRRKKVRDDSVTGGRFAMRKDSAMDEVFDGVVIDPETGKAGQLTDVFTAAFKREMDDFRETQTIPAVPAALKPYIPQETQQQLPQLWKDGTSQAVETVALVYSQAMVQYSYDVQELNVGDLSGDLDQSVRDDIRTIYGKLVTETIEKTKKDDSAID